MSLALRFLASPSLTRSISSELVTPKEGEWEQMRKTVNMALAANAGTEASGR